MAVAGILAIVLLAILTRVGLGRLDKQKVADFVEQRGGRVVSVSWAPFGRGWFGEKNDRIYEVVYYDSRGRQHFATAKTNLWSDVFWNEDTVTHEKPGWYDRVPASNEPGDPIVRKIGNLRVETEPDDGAEVAPEVEAEVERLRHENERLRAELAKRDH